MTRRCSHCSCDGHNSRTCPSTTTGGVRLFGFRLTDASSTMKKSASMGNLNLSSLSHFNNSSTSTTASPSANPSSPSSDTHNATRDGYSSDDPTHLKRRTDRKKGTPWAEEEHRLFLIGLQKLGKGDWCGIARNYVLTRTPTQVASHAQKYFIRQSNASRRKRRTSLFDMNLDMETDTASAPENFLLPPQLSQRNQVKPELQTTQNMESRSMEMTMEETINEYDKPSVQGSYMVPIPVIPTFYPAYVPVPFRFWSPNIAPTEEENPPESSSNHQVLKPIPVIRKDPINVDEIVGLSHLSIKETKEGPADSNHLSERLLGSPSRQSAFRPRRSFSVPSLTQGSAEEKAAV